MSQKIMHVVWMDVRPYYSMRLLLSCNGHRSRIKLSRQAHFADLLERYGAPLLVLDLVKHTEKRERESIVGQDYRSAIEHVNSTIPPVSARLLVPCVLP